MAAVFRVGYACGQPAVTRHGWALLLGAREQQIRRRFAAIATKFFAGNALAATPRATLGANPGATPQPAMAATRQRAENGPASAMPRYSDVLRDEAVTYAGYLRDLMHDPEMLAVLAGSPQARRTLRELMRLYSYEGPLPDCMRSPLRRSPTRRSPSRRRQPSAPASADVPPASPTAPSPPPANPMPGSRPPAGTLRGGDGNHGRARPARPQPGRLGRHPHPPPKPARPRIGPSSRRKRVSISLRYQYMCER
jgi:hypothetical protein